MPYLKCCRFNEINSRICLPQFVMAATRIRENLHTIQSHVHMLTEGKRDAIYIGLEVSDGQSFGLPELYLHFQKTV